MPLTLVTGPANSAKAGEVLGGLRARLDDEPILVVPAFGDVEHSQRELAERGAVFGAQVLRFDRLFGQIAELTGYRGKVASQLQRELIVEEAVRGARLEVLAESARQPGFARAAARFLRELHRSMIEPARFTRALREWAGEGPRRRYAEEVASIFRRYRDGLDEAELTDPELYAWRALNALRNDPEAWPGTPLFVYGFDDFTPLELDALDTLANRCGADVSVSLPYERGREAFRTVASTHAELQAVAAREVELEPVSDHYAGASREALHHLERELFQPELPERVEPGPAVRLHSSGGERAEVELAGAAVLELLREGVEPGDVAVVFRDPQQYASLLEQVFGAYGIPYSIDRSLKLAHTGLGRGLLALIRCAAFESAQAEDLLTWLRTPGRLEQPWLADWLEREARTEGATSAAQARELWERERFKLDELDRLREAGTVGDFIAELTRQLERMFAEPYRRQAPVLTGPELDDPRAFRTARRALRELGGLAGALDRRRVHDTLAELPVHLGENPQPDRVQVARPGAIRARRFEAVFVCGLQEQEFPRGSAADPFLPDEDRFAVNAASGLRLPLREDQLDRERYLFYVCASRAERLLVLSSRYCDEDGNPQTPSFFVEDVKDLFTAIPERRRSLSDVTWAPDAAPTVAEWERSMALRGPRREDGQPGPLRAEPVLRWLAEREAVSAGALEQFADCPVKWLVESLLRPDALEPDPEQMVRGRYAHTVLQRTYERLREETGDRRVTQSNLPVAERLMMEELVARRSEFRLSPKQTRVKAAVRRLEFDLLRYLRYDAARDGSFEPEFLEYDFEDVDVDGVTLRGRIDRVDTWNGHALVSDYKSGKSVGGYKVASWEKENRFQAALYMLAVQKQLGLRPAGGVYVPLGGEDRRPRGMVAAGVPALGSGYVPNDVLAEDEFDEKLGWARDRIADTAGQMERGELRCTPDSCAWNGGCSHPSICRVEE